jgi:hypothetical protein
MQKRRRRGGRLTEKLTEGRETADPGGGRMERGSRLIFGDVGRRSNAS